MTNTIPNPALGACVRQVEATYHRDDGVAGRRVCNSGQSLTARGPSNRENRPARPERPRRPLDGFKDERPLQFPEKPAVTARESLRWSEIQ